MQQESVFIGCWKNTNKLISFVSGPPKHCMRAMTTGCNNIRKNHASSIDRMTELGVRILTLTPGARVTSMGVGVIYAAAAPQKPNDTPPLKVMAGTYPSGLISLLAMCIYVKIILMIELLIIPMTITLQKLQQIVEK